MDKLLDFLLSSLGLAGLIPVAAYLAYRRHISNRHAEFENAKALKAMVCLNHEPPVRARITYGLDMVAHYNCPRCRLWRRKPVFQRMP